jgi:hypothetical protein
MCNPEQKEINFSYCVSLPFSVTVRKNIYCTYLFYCTSVYCVLCGLQIKDERPRPDRTAPGENQRLQGLVIHMLALKYKI